MRYRARQLPDRREFFLGNELFLQDPQVSVFIKEFTSQRITVEGAVARPGIYPIRGDTTLVQAIALAGGQGQLPDLTEVMVFRLEAGQRRQLTYDLIKIRGGEIEDPKLAELAKQAK